MAFIVMILNRQLDRVFLRQHHLRLRFRFGQHRQVVRQGVRFKHRQAVRQGVHFKHRQAVQQEVRSKQALRK